MTCAVPLAALLRLPTALGAQEAPGPVDTAYFDAAPRSLRRHIRGVLSIAVDRSGDPYPAGLTSLELRRAPERRAPVVKRCDDPLSSRSAEPQTLCGWRLLGSKLEGPGGRILLPVTGTRAQEPARWHQVVTDPETDARGWIEEAPPMRYLSLREWLASADRLLRTTTDSHGADILRAAPRETGALVELWDFGPVALLYRGMDRNWVRVTLQGPGCRLFEEGREVRASRRPCPSGWLRWRAADGALLLLPNSF